MSQTVAEAERKKETKRLEQPAMNGLGVGLTVVFVVLVAALFSQLLYVLWRHRDFRRRTSTLHADDGSEFSFASSKENLYFPNAERQSDGASNGSFQDGIPSMDQTINPYKLPREYGPPPPSRVLCTIKEEEKWDLESEMSLSSAEKEARETKTVWFGVVSEEAPPDQVAMTVELDGDEDVVVEVATPFSTPCASPFYFTPVASPSREADDGSTSTKDEVDELVMINAVS